MNDSKIYRCNMNCPIGKSCFILKTKVPLNEDITVLYKCKFLKRDIEIKLSKDK